MRILGSAALAFAAAIGPAGCSAPGGPAAVRPAETTLTIGFGLTSGANAQAGIRQAVANIAYEGLIAFDTKSRPQAWLADRWSYSDDGLQLRIELRKGVKFHDGSPVSAAGVRAMLQERLPQELGPAYDDVAEIRAPSETVLEFALARRSAFVLEGLGLPVQGSRTGIVGTGPFQTGGSQGAEIEMRANRSHHGGNPAIDRIVLRPYESTRAAWADMLRGEVDMLYDVGADALDSLGQSNDVRIVSHRRPYTYLLQFNMRHPRLRHAGLRRALNAAIDRAALVEDVLQGRGIPANGPVWPSHWAYDATVPGFRYEPRAVDGTPLRLSCIFADAALERLALTIQRQLLTIGVQLDLELMPVDDALTRVTSGAFDLFLADATHGPSLLRPYLFWRTAGRYNWGGFSSPAVDAALDSIRHAASDDAYRAGVAAFQRAIVEDPPAVFLAWSERARAVSTRFDVPVEPGRDVLSTLRLWRPAVEN